MSISNIFISEITPTVFLRNGDSGPEQLVRINIINQTEKSIPGILFLTVGNENREHDIGSIMPGESRHKVFITEQKQQVKLVVQLGVAGSITETKETVVYPPKHWRVHVVQLSHHDMGYTGLPSNVKSKQARYLDQAIEMAEATAGHPDDAKFRITLEQQWSLDAFLNSAPRNRIDKMIRLLREGRFELTALFGNMTTELCGHESLIRTLYPSFRLKKEYGIPVISAEHNDITGISWGLCRLLTDMGIKIFTPGLPLYYSWSEPNYQNFWNQEEIFGYDNAPGAFWWEAATGKRLLFWCNNRGCGGSWDPSFNDLEDALRNLESKPYASSVLRWPVQGGGRDNSPYIMDFADTVKKWNETWLYPRLICSTNAKFYEEFSRTDLSGLPVHRGELPGQDYPVGAMSKAGTTSMNRRNHHSLLSAEKLAVIAEAVTDYQYQAYELENARYSMLCFEEHVWGHVFSHGPAMDGAEAEKAVHACRTSAYAHDVKQKALAKIADNIKKTSDEIHLVVFNLLGIERTGFVRLPMREIENSEVIMEQKDGVLINSALQGRAERTHLILPEEFVSGDFTLIDNETGKETEIQLLKISDEDSDAIYAAQRSGLAQGRKDYFNRCGGWDYDLCFVAENIPAMGYKMYRLKPSAGNAVKIKTKSADPVIENEYYRITVDNKKGIVSSIYDKEVGRELIDAKAPYRFGEIIVRSPFADSIGQMNVIEKPEIQHGRIVSSISLKLSVHAHPVVSQKILLYAGVKRIDFTVKILKQSTPLLDVHIAFPFELSGPCFSYEGGLNILEPVKDFLPGAYSDILSIRNWVKISSHNYSLIWSSHDSPLVNLGKLWPGYVSPAHKCVLPERMRHTPQQTKDFNKSWIYSNIFDNNFCTNFSVSQNGEFVFNYSMMTAAGALSASETILAGMDMSTPLECIFSTMRNMGELLPRQSFIKIADKNIVLLHCKSADNDEGIIMRFWNPADIGISSRIECLLVKIKEVCEVNPAEEETGISFPCDKHGFQIEIGAHGVLSVRVLDAGMKV